MKLIQYLFPLAAAMLAVGCSSPMTYAPAQDTVPIVVITRPTRSSPYLSISMEYPNGNGRPAILWARYQEKTITCRYPTTPSVCNISLKKNFGITEGTPDGHIEIALSYGTGGDTFAQLSRIKIQNDEFMVPKFRVRLEKAAVYSAPSVTSPSGEIESRNSELFRFDDETNGYVSVCSSRNKRSWIRLSAGEKLTQVQDGYRSAPC